MSAVNPLSSSAASAERKPYEPSMEEILASIRRIIADDQSLPGRTIAREAEPPPAPHVEPPAAETPVAPPPVEPEPRSADELAPMSESLDFRPQFVSEVPEVDLTPEPEANPAAHGQVAAPQFVSPEGPHGSPQDVPTIIHALAEPQAFAEPDALDAAAAEPVEHPTHAVADAPEPPHPSYETEVDPGWIAEEDQRSYEPPSAPDPGVPLFSAATDTSVTSAFNLLAASRLADNSDELLGLAREMIRPLLRAWLDDNLPSMVERMVRAEIERVARGGR